MTRLQTISFVITLLPLSYCSFLAYLSDVDLLLVLAGSGAVAGEDGRAVTVLVLVDETDGVVQGVYLHGAKHRSEDLLLVALHVRLEAMRGSG